MNFDDIMNGGLSSQSNLGENITDIFEVDEKFAMQSTRDLVDLITNTDSTDADIIQFLSIIRPSSLTPWIIDDY